jgi:hypothetical protein
MTGKLEERFFEIQCMKCKKIGLLSSGLCRHGCGAVHTVTVI